MLILFDIDGTLITSRAAIDDGGSCDGVGAVSMVEAGRNLYGSAFTLEGIEIAGRLDVLIWRDAVRQAGVVIDDANVEAEHQRFRDAYGRALESRLVQGARVRALPGALELVDRLAGIGSVTLGLLTGNYPETGRLKIEAAGFDASRFVVGAWGCDGESRRHLPPVAMRAHAELCGTQIECERVVIIGDTPHDIDCARAHGCRSLGVATGKFTLGELLDCGADHAVADLSQTGAVMEWLLNCSVGACD